MGRQIDEWQVERCLERGARTAAEETLAGTEAELEGGERYSGKLGQRGRVALQR
jgi:hypothetical protein